MSSKVVVKLSGERHTPATKKLILKNLDDSLVAIGLQVPGRTSFQGILLKEHQRNSINARSLTPGTKGYVYLYPDSCALTIS